MPSHLASKTHPAVMKFGFKVEPDKSGIMYRSCTNNCRLFKQSSGQLICYEILQKLHFVTKLWFSKSHACLFLKLKTSRMWKSLSQWTKLYLKTFSWRFSGHQHTINSDSSRKFWVLVKWHGYSRFCLMILEIEYSRYSYWIICSHTFPNFWVLSHAN